MAIVINSGHIAADPIVRESGHESHPGKSLVLHLNNVSKSASSILKDLQKYCTCVSDPALLDVIKIIGFSHDIAKSTTFFQEYLHNPIIQFDPFLKSHSTLSSIYAYYVTEHRDIDDDFLSFLIPMLIQGHHGKIPSPRTVINRIKEHRRELEEQLKHVLHVDELDCATNSENYPRFLSSKDLLNNYRLIDFHYKLKVPFDLSVKKFAQSLKPFFIANMLFSILIDADRLDAAELDVKERSPIDSQLVADYIDRIEKEALHKFGDGDNDLPSSCLQISPWSYTILKIILV
jgi:CRISPR-associated endonuclease/helicase Cas3